MSEFSNTSIFIFGAGGRQVLPVCEGFHALGCRIINYCFSKWDTGLLTKYKTEGILYDKEQSGGKDFFEYGLELIRRNRYTVVVPLSDAVAIYLSKHKKEISEFTAVAVNDWEVLKYAIDKAETMRICMENDIPAPMTFYGDEILNYIDWNKLTFPVVVKPRTGVGSIGFNIINTKEQLDNYLKCYAGKNGPLLVQEYIKQGAQPQYRADLFRTSTGEYKAACVGKVTRWYPLDGGSGIHIVSVKEQKILEHCKRLLDCMNWNGYANIDLVFDENSNTAKIIEINGRVGASIKIDYVSGVNISQLILEHELGMPVTDMNEYFIGKQVSCFLPDLLWFVTSKNRFNAHPSWFNRFGVQDTIFSWRDPKPTLGFIIQSISGFIPAMKKRKRVK